MIVVERVNAQQMANPTIFLSIGPFNTLRYDDHLLGESRTFFTIIMASLNFYGFPYSQPTRSVLMLLKAAGIEFENHVLNIFAGLDTSPPLPLTFHQVSTNMKTT